MATTKNITMKQFNGTDYDTLYPKTVAAQIDDVYSQQQILSDATKTLYGLESNASPDDVFSWVFSWIDQEAPRIETGTYVGTGTYGASNPCSLTFGFVPKMVFIIKDNAQVLSGNSYGYSFTCGFLSSQLSTEYKDIIVSPRNLEPMSVKLNNKTIYWYNQSQTPGVDTSGFMLNASGITYHYIALG